MYHHFGDFLYEELKEKKRNGVKSESFTSQLQQNIPVTVCETLLLYDAFEFKNNILYNP